MFQAVITYWIGYECSQTFEIHDVAIVTWKFEVTMPETKYQTFITYWSSALASSLTLTVLFLRVTIMSNKSHCQLGDDETEESDRDADLKDDGNIISNAQTAYLENNNSKKQLFLMCFRLAEDNKDSNAWSWC